GDEMTGQVVLPYGIPVLEQLLQFLSDLIKPKGKEDTIVFGLSLINLVLETAGTGLGAHPSLVSVLQGDLSKYLLQNSETNELQVLSLTLRVVFNLFNSIKDHLKVQLEIFFTSVHMRIMDSPSCSNEQKELALESLLEFCREPALMLDLYINYDCDVHCTNLFEVLCTALAQTTQGETLLAECYFFVNVHDAGKQNKKRYFLAAEKFHSEPKNWIAYSQQLGLLPNPITAESVAAFFHQTPGLNKTSIGDYLGDGPKEDKPFHEAVRNAYVAMFDFRNAPLDEALRMCLAKFRLPGEAQKIDRLMEAFAKEYFHQIQTEEHPFAHEDCAFILSFSIIMLNTDLHSDQIQKKMTLDEFVRNNRGINGGQDLPREYLELLYNNIKANQIKMQTDISDMQVVTTVDRYSAQWDGILKRQENVVGASFTSNASILKLRAGRHEREMFALIVDSTTESILNAFERTCDEMTMQKALDGITNCIKIAVYFNMLPELNKLLAALAAYVVEFAHSVLNGDKHSKSGKLRERTRRLAERQAAHRQTMPSTLSQHPASFWDSLSYWWGEEEGEADTDFPLVSAALREAVSRCGQGLLEREMWLKFCRKLHSRSIEALLKALLHRKTGKSETEGDMVQENAMLALEWATNVILVNLHRFGALWPLMHTYVAQVLTDPSKPLLVERVRAWIRSYLVETSFLPCRFVYMTRTLASSSIPEIDFPVWSCTSM
ncbi:hypothetical protein DYB32_009551, partial [Aphanomyces invadans]